MMTSHAPKSFDCCVKCGEKMKSPSSRPVFLRFPVDVSDKCNQLLGITEPYRKNPSNPIVSSRLNCIHGPNVSKHP